MKCHILQHFFMVYNVSRNVHVQYNIVFEPVHEIGNNKAF